MVVVGGRGGSGVPSLSAALFVSEPSSTVENGRERLGKKEN